MGFVQESLKKLLKKAGYTVLRGDIRQQVRAQATDRNLPSHLLQQAKVCSNRYEVLQSLPKGGTAVEVGVAYGDFTTHILDVLQPERFIAIDTFGIVKGDEPWGRKLLEEGQCTHIEYYSRRFKSQIDGGTMQLKQGLSWEMLEQLPDHSIDYLYVDADHSYDSVSRETQALRSKMKSTGIIQFNDYTYFDQHTLEPYGIPRAVHEFMEAEQYEMLYLCLHPQGFYDVVLRRINN